jgi:hypothetical protein
MSRWGKYQDFADLPEQAFKKLGRRMTLEGGGGGTTTSTQYTSSLPEYAKPYFEDIMNRGQAASLAPYQAYGGQRVAGFSPTQTAAHDMTSQISLGGTPQGLQAGQQIGMDVANRLSQYSYDPTRFQEERVQAAQGNASQMGPYERVQGAQINPYQDIAAQQVSAPGQLSVERVGNQLSARDIGTIQSFMSPYQQLVTDTEKAAAVRDYQIGSQMRGAQAARAGAFGGSRQAVETAEAQRALTTQLGGIQSKGMQGAYEQGVQALQAQRAAELQAAQSNQQYQQQATIRGAEFGMQAQQLNQQADLAAQQGNQQQANQIRQQAAQLQQQANLANQQAGLTTEQANAQMRQQMEMQNMANTMQSQQLNQQANLEAQKASEASRQFGATSGLQAMQQLGAQGQQLGAMGEAEQKLAFDRAQALGGVGKEQQALQQQELDQSYADFSAQRDYEQNMINWYNNILRGVPVSMNQSVYTPAPSTASQVAGLGLAGLGAYRAGQGN